MPPKGSGAKGASALRDASSASGQTAMTDYLPNRKIGAYAKNYALWDKRVSIDCSRLGLVGDELLASDGTVNVVDRSTHAVKALAEAEKDAVCVREIDKGPLLIARSEIQGKLRELLRQEEPSEIAMYRLQAHVATKALNEQTNRMNFLEYEHTLKVAAEKNMPHSHGPTAGSGMTFDVFQAKVQQEEQKSKRLQSDLLDEQNKLVSANSKIEEQAVSLRDISSKLTELQLKLDTANSTISTNTSTMAEQVSSVALAKTTIETHVSTIESLQLNVPLLEARTRDLQLAKDTIEKQTATIKGLRKNRWTRMSQLMTKQVALQGSAQRLFNTNRKLFESNQQLSKANNDNVELLADVQRLEAELNSRVQEVESKTSQLNRQAHDLNATTKALQKSYEDAETLEADLEECETNMSDLEIDLGVANGSLRAWTNYAKAKASALQFAKTTNSELRKSLTSTAAALKVSEETVKDQTTALFNINNANSGLQNSLTTKTNELNVSEEIVKSSTSEIELAGTTLSTLKSQFAELQNSFETARDSLSTSEEDLACALGVLTFEEASSRKAKCVLALFVDHHNRQMTIKEASSRKAKCVLALFVDHHNRQMTIKDSIIAHKSDGLEAQSRKTMSLAIAFRSDRSLIATTLQAELAHQQAHAKVSKAEAVEMLLKAMQCMSGSLEAERRKNMSLVMAKKDQALQVLKEYQAEMGLLVSLYMMIALAVAVKHQHDTIAALHNSVVVQRDGAVEEVRRLEREGRAEANATDTWVQGKETILCMIRTSIDRAYTGETRTLGDLQHLQSEMELMKAKLEGKQKMIEQSSEKVRLAEEERNDAWTEMDGMEREGIAQALVIQRYAEDRDFTLDLMKTELEGKQKVIEQSSEKVRLAEEERNGAWTEMDGLEREGIAQALAVQKYAEDREILREWAYERGQLQERVAEREMLLEWVDELLTDVGH